MTKVLKLKQIYRIPNKLHQNLQERSQKLINYSLTPKKVYEKM